MTTCKSCHWHSHDTETDRDTDKLAVWRCWRESGCPSVRLTTSSKREPKACVDHYKGEKA